MSKRFFAIVLIAIAAVVGVFWFSSHKASSPPASSVQPTNHVVGAGTSGVTLTEYGDFQCPACGAYFPIVKSVRQHFGDQIKFQFRNFPLTQLHQNAMAAHRAAEAAGNQGKFFEMHDLLYQRQQAWSSTPNPGSIFEGYAQELGLDMTQFRLDVASQKTFDIINADIREGEKIGANSTPTFVLDGKKVDQNPRSLDEFIKLIDDAIKAKATGQQ